MCNRVIFFKQIAFIQGLGDPKSLSTTWNHFVFFLIPFWIRNEFWKSFGIWKWFRKFFVIWIQFWNCFQTIEVQVNTLWYKLLGFQKFSKSFWYYKSLSNPFHIPNELYIFSKWLNHTIRRLLHHLKCIIGYFVSK